MKVQSPTLNYNIKTFAVGIYVRAPVKPCVKYKSSFKEIFKEQGNRSRRLPYVKVLLILIPVSPLILLYRLPFVILHLNLAFFQV